MTTDCDVCGDKSVACDCLTMGAPTPPEPRCDACRFFTADAVQLTQRSAEVNDGVCRRMPPIMFYDHVGKRFVIGPTPVEGNRDWCGEFQPKPPKPPAIESSRVRANPTSEGAVP